MHGGVQELQHLRVLPQEVAGPGAQELRRLVAQRGLVLLQDQELEEPLVVEFTALQRPEQPALQVASEPVAGRGRDCRARVPDPREQALRRRKELLHPLVVEERPAQRRFQGGAASRSASSTPRRSR